MNNPDLNVYLSSCSFVMFRKRCAVAHVLIDIFNQVSTVAHIHLLLLHWGQFFDSPIYNVRLFQNSTVVTIKIAASGYMHAHWLWFYSQSMEHGWLWTCCKLSRGCSDKIQLLLFWHELHLQQCKVRQVYLYSTSTAIQSACLIQNAK